VAELAHRFNESEPEQMTGDLAAVARLFAKFDLVEPGVTQAGKWRPDQG
jgi:hypothetical protein